MAASLAACAQDDPTKAPGSGSADSESGNGSGGESDSDGTGGGAGDPLDDSDAHAPFVRACSRLHGECSAVCDNLLVECYDDVATCATQWQADYTEDFRYPLVVDGLLSECAAQVDRAACTDIEPDTFACEFAIVDSCPDDADGDATPYSPVWAVPLAVGTPVRIFLCADVPEYYEVELAAGQSIELEMDESAPRRPFARLMLLSTDARGEIVADEFSPGTPVPEDGTYIMLIDTIARGDYAFTIAVES
jgi:hypothetical protein